MKLDSVLLEILVCPECKGTLTVDEDHDELICNGCGLIYPVRDDIPVMLVEEARRPPGKAGGTAAGDKDAERMPEAGVDSGSETETSPSSGGASDAAGEPTESAAESGSPDAP